MTRGELVGLPVGVAEAFANSGSANCQPSNGSSPVSLSVQVAGFSTNVNWPVVTAVADSAACRTDCVAETQYRWRTERTTISGCGGTDRGVRPADLGGAPLPGGFDGAWTDWTLLSTVTMRNQDCPPSGCNVNSLINLNNGPYRFEVVVRRVCRCPGDTCWSCVSASIVGCWSSSWSQQSAGIVAAAPCDSPAP